MELLSRIWEMVRPHWALIGFILTWVGIAIVYWRKRGEWRRKQFMNVVNFSLNYVGGKRLMLRTLLELPSTEVWLNEYGIKKVMRAAEKTTAQQPFVTLPDREDMAFVRRAALNVLSERFAEGFLAVGCGATPLSKTFVFALTFERYADMRTQKFRVILMEKESLIRLFEGGGEKELELMEAHHRDRIATLRAMHTLLRQPDPKQAGILGEVELGVVV